MTFKMVRNKLGVVLKSSMSLTESGLLNSKQIFSCLNILSFSIVFLLFLLGADTTLFVYLHVTLFTSCYVGADTTLFVYLTLFTSCVIIEADTTPFAVQAEVTLKTNFFATRDMLTHFLPLVKTGGTANKPHGGMGCDRMLLIIYIIFFHICVCVQVVW